MRLLVWDFDGTLAFRSGLWSGTLAAVAARHRPDLGLEAAHFRPFLSTGFRWHAPERIHPARGAAAWWAELHPVFERAYRETGVNPADARAWAAEVRAEYLNLELWAAFPDAEAVLRQLSDAGWTHALLTNHVPEFGALLGGLGLRSPFTVVVNSADTGFEKPHPEAFREVLRRVGVPERVCMIGDSPDADMRGAQGVGWPAVLVHREQAWCPARQLTDVPGLLERL